MSKKKLIAIVCSGTLLFLIASILINFFICMELSGRDFKDNLHVPMHTISNFSWDYEVNEEKKATAKCSGMSDISVFMQKYLENSEAAQLHYNYPTVFRAYDEDGNEYEAYNNYIRIYLENEDADLYINLDEYLNNEQIEKLYSSGKDKYLAVTNIKLGHDGDKYILNEVTITDHADEKFTFTFSTKGTLVETKYPASLYINEIRQKNYDKIYYAKINEAIDKSYQHNNNIQGNGGGGSFSAEEGFGHHHIEINGIPYEIFYGSKYNLPLKAITSFDFKNFNSLIITVVCITGLIFLLLSLKIYKKNEMLEKSKQTFISAAAHELKTPIAVIQNQCECVMENVIPEKNDEYLKSIYDEALRMNDIVSTLLSFNRLSNIEKIEKEKCNFSEIVYDEAEKYHAFAESQNAKIQLDIKEDVYVNCNRELITLAIDNYLSNAVKYSTNEKSIKITLDENKTSFIFEVFNTCDFIDKNIVDKMWGIFEKQDESRTRDGNSTGLGLPICKKIFDLHEFSGKCSFKENGVVFSISGKK